MTNIKLWLIFVPTRYNEKDGGGCVRRKWHQKWDEQVRAITGGLTVWKPAHGQWVAPDGTLYRDRVIPVYIACTEGQIQTISDFSAKHYRQLAIMIVKVSDVVHINHYDPKKSYARIVPEDKPIEIPEPTEFATEEY